MGVFWCVRSKRVDIFWCSKILHWIITGGDGKIPWLWSDEWLWSWGCLNEQKTSDFQGYYTVAGGHYVTQYARKWHTICKKEFFALQRPHVLKAAHHHQRYQDWSISFCEFNCKPFWRLWGIWEQAAPAFLHNYLWRSSLNFCTHTLLQISIRRRLGCEALLIAWKNIRSSLY